MFNKTSLIIRRNNALNIIIKYTSLFKMFTFLYFTENSWINILNYCNRFSRTLNEKFKVILFLQFCAIAFILCFNLYRMTTITMIPKLLEASLYLIRVLVQILYYCWFSNEVKLKVSRWGDETRCVKFFLNVSRFSFLFSSSLQSLEVPGMIFKSDWTSWDDKTKKIFLIIMTRATQPFEFTSGYLVTLNLEFFVAVSIK